MTSSPADIENTLGGQNARGWGKSLERCESIVPLADGRFLVIHGTSGTYDPATDIHDTALGATESVLRRLRET